MDTLKDPSTSLAVRQSQTDNSSDSQSNQFDMVGLGLAAKALVTYTVCSPLTFTRLSMIDQEK